MKLKMTFLTIGLLVLGAVAVPAMAQPDDQSDRQGRDFDAQSDRRADQQEKRDAKFAEIKERCLEKHNESERCDKIRDAAQPEKQARREANALQHAIDALYKRVGKLEMKEYQIEQRMEGNMSDNDTAKAEKFLERIESAQEKALERIQHLEAKLAELKEKWSEVRDHVDAMRAKNGDDDSADDVEEEHEAESEDSESSHEDSSEDDLSDEDES